MATCCGVVSSESPSTTTLASLPLGRSSPEPSRPNTKPSSRKFFWVVTSSVLWTVYPSVSNCSAVYVAVVASISSLTSVDMGNIVVDDDLACCIEDSSECCGAVNAKHDDDDDDDDDRDTVAMTAALDKDFIVVLRKSITAG